MGTVQQRLGWSDRYNALATEKETIKNDFILRYWNMKWANFQSDWEFKYNTLQAESTGATEEKDVLIINWTNKYNILNEEKEALNNEWKLKWNNFNSEWESKIRLF